MSDATVSFDIKRNAEAATYSLDNSNVNQRLFNRSATIPVVLLPPKMSTTKSLSSVSIFMKNSGSAAGNAQDVP